MKKRALCLIVSAMLAFGCFNAAFAAAGGIEITTVQIENNTVLSIEVSASDAPTDCVAVAAVFDADESFAGAEISENILKSGFSGSFTFTFGEGLSVAEGQTVKAFVWRYDGGLTAIPAAAGFAVTVGGDDGNETKDESVNLAEFVFHVFDVPATDEVDGSKSTGYAPMAGVLIDSAKLFASVNDDGLRKLERAIDETETYAYGDDAVYPGLVTAGSKNNWGSSPYIEARLSTVGYEEITVSAKLGGSKKGPKNYTLQYSTDGENYVDVASYSITKNKTMEQAFLNVPLPAEASNCELLRVRLAVSGEETVSGAALSDNPASGEIAITDFVIGTNGKAEVTYVPERSPSGAADDVAETDGIIHLLSTSINADGVDNVTVDGTTLTITASGDYEIEGVLNDGRIVVSPELTKSDNVNITLSGVDVTSTVGSPFCAAEAKVSVILSDGTENTFTDPEVYTDTTGNACFYSKRDLSVSGGGSLTVNGNANNAIGTKADLEILGGTISVTAANNGLKGNDSVTIGDGTITVVSSGDGIKSDNISEEDKGYVKITGGTISITSGEDGIQADLLADISGGSITIKSGAEGIKVNGDTADETEPAVSDGRIAISGGSFNITSGEDAIKSTAASVTVTDGEFFINTRQDGIQAETALNISGGTFDIFSDNAEVYDYSVIDFFNDPSLTEAQYPITNINDGNTATYWTSNSKEAYVICDLGEVKTVGKIGVAEKAVENREYYYELLISEDGITYTPIYDGTNGYNNGDMVYNMANNTDARFVKALFKGNSYHDWNSVSELEICGECTQLDSSDSLKGLKGVQEVNIGGGSFSLETIDDAVHSDGNITISGGAFRIYTDDDAIHADGNLSISGDETYIQVDYCYEGLEALVINILGGTVYVTASDDGLNATNGETNSAGQPENTPGGGNNWGGGGNNWGGGFGMFSVEASATDSILINIEGGFVSVNAGGDGIDSNGNVTMSGGTVLVCGPSSSDDAALDFDGSFTQTGGLLAAAGSSGMAQAPSGSQYVAKITYRSSQSANTIVRIASSSGADIVTFAPCKAYNSLVVSSPDFVKDETYYVYSGGSCTGTNTGGLYSGGAYTGGTQKASFKTSSTVTSVSVN